MSAAQNKAIVQRTAGSWEEGEKALFGALDQACTFPFLANYGLPPTLEGYKAYWSTAQGSFSDGYTPINEIVAEDDKVMAWTTQSAKHIGPWRNVPATNKQVTYRTIQFFRFREGKIIELNVLYDTFSFLQQLGAIPAS